MSVPCHGNDGRFSLPEPDTAAPGPAPKNGRFRRLVGRWQRSKQPVVNPALHRERRSNAAGTFATG